MVDVSMLRTAEEAKLRLPPRYPARILNLPFTGRAARKLNSAASALPRLLS